MYPFDISFRDNLGKSGVKTKNDMNTFKRDELMLSLFRRFVTDTNNVFSRVGIFSIQERHLFAELNYWVKYLLPSNETSLQQHKPFENPISLSENLSIDFSSKLIYITCSFTATRQKSHRVVFQVSFSVSLKCFEGKKMHSSSSLERSKTLFCAMYRKYFTSFNLRAGMGDF